MFQKVETFEVSIFELLWGPMPPWLAPIPPAMHGVKILWAIYPYWLKQKFIKIHNHNQVRGQVLSSKKCEVKL